MITKILLTSLIVVLAGALLGCYFHFVGSLAAKGRETSRCERVDIIQTYLKSEPDEEMRVRQRGSDGHYVYYQTVKKAVTGLKRIEIEQRLTKEEYLCLLMQADPDMRQIRKDRYCLTYDNQYFEIDVYPFWKDKAIVEIELREETQEIRFPEQLRVIREVTDDDAYKNSSLAKI